LSYCCPCCGPISALLLPNDEEEEIDAEIANQIGQLKIGGLGGIYVYIYIYLYIYAYIYIYIHIYVYVYIICKFVYVNTYIYIYIYIYIYSEIANQIGQLRIAGLGSSGGIYGYTYVYTYMFIYMMCIYICEYIYIYIHIFGNCWSGVPWRYIYITGLCCLFVG
jgi:hypothetical protein